MVRHFVSATTAPCASPVGVARVKASPRDRAVHERAWSPRRADSDEALRTATPADVASFRRSRSVRAPPIRVVPTSSTAGSTALPPSCSTASCRYARPDPARRGPHEGRHILLKRARDATQRHRRSRCRSATRSRCALRPSARRALARGALLAREKFGAAADELRTPDKQCLPHRGDHRRSPVRPHADFAKRRRQHRGCRRTRETPRSSKPKLSARRSVSGCSWKTSSTKVRRIGFSLHPAAFGRDRRAVPCAGISAGSSATAARECTMPAGHVMTSIPRHDAANRACLRHWLGARQPGVIPQYGEVLGFLSSDHFDTVAYAAAKGAISRFPGMPPPPMRRGAFASTSSPPRWSRRRWRPRHAGPGDPRAPPAQAAAHRAPLTTRIAPRPHSISAAAPPARSPASCCRSMPAGA